MCRGMKGSQTCHVRKAAGWRVAKNYSDRRCKGMFWGLWASGKKPFAFPKVSSLKSSMQGKAPSAFLAMKTLCTPASTSAFPHWGDGQHCRHDWRSRNNLRELEIAAPMSKRNEEELEWLASTIWQHSAHFFHCSQLGNLRCSGHWEPWWHWLKSHKLFRRQIKCRACCLLVYLG